MVGSATVHGAPPVAAGELRFELERVAREIAEALRQQVEPGTLPPGLASGDAGLAVLYAAMHAQWPGEGWGVQARAHWEAAANGIFAAPSSSSLFSGFPGVAWAALRIRGAILPDLGPDSFREVDDFLTAVVNRARWPASYDLVNGIVGRGVYLLDRLPSTHAASGLARIVHHLEKRAVTQNGGLTWHTPPEALSEWQRQIAPKGYLNLGLAHGVPGVVALLGRMAAVRAGGPGVGALLEGAVRWVLAQEIRGARGVRYPAWVHLSPDGAPPRPSRVAWCYGDLGVAAALVLAAASVDREDWMKAGVRLARKVASLSFDQTGVLDAGICHGAAGVAHLFHRMARTSRDPILAGACRHWLRRTLEMRRREGIAGFPASRQYPDGRRYWVDEPGLLEGAAGVALVFLAAIAERPPDWDRFLLISGPHQEAA